MNLKKNLKAAIEMSNHLKEAKVIKQFNTELLKIFNFTNNKK
jgi:hypothetical protein